jgi:hypothetical protein
MTTPDRSWTLAATGAPRAPHRPALPWWPQVLIALRPPAWLAVVAALVALGLLLAFQQVVAGSVAQGELRRAHAQAQASGAWRCNLLHDRAERKDCLAQLDGAPNRRALQGRDVHGEP